MPRYDFECPKCKRVYPDKDFSNWRDASGDYMVACDDCEVRLVKLPCAPNFAVKGYNAANGYGRKE
jgi:predicted nucleic acid-binding Zn ribbon protein